VDEEEKDKRAAAIEIVAELQLTAEQLKVGLVAARLCQEGRVGGEGGGGCRINIDLPEYFVSSPAGLWSG